MRSSSLHEDLSRRHIAPLSSNRQFGFCFAAFFLLVSLWPLKAGGRPRLWSAALSLLLLALALLRPGLLAAPNRLWTRLGLLLGRISAFVVTALLLYLVFTPAGLWMRFRRKDTLRLKRDPHAPTYWIERRPPGPAPETMSNQF